jgi:porin
VSAAQAAAEPPAAAPESAAASPWRWAGAYKADLASTSAPASRSLLLGNLGFSLDGDAEALWGWPGTSLHAELLWNHGGKPNHVVGSVQGVDNIEVEQSAARLYAAWIERQFAATGSRLLLGLYDLNSEFYATDASGMLVHPSFGIGPDFSQSGRNGPSIFPNLGLALRAKQVLGESHSLQVAVIDGVPGNPAHIGRTEVHLSRADGALLVAELGWQQQGESGPQPGHWGLGAWHYTAKTAALGSGGLEHNQGVYAVGQVLLRDGPQARTTGFLRWGAARAQINRLSAAAEAGFLIDKPFGDHGPEAFTAGFAFGRFGGAYRTQQALSGQAIAVHETALELGARWALSEGLTLQPYLQHIVNAGGVGATSAVVGGARLQWSFGPTAE